MSRCRLGLMPLDHTGSEISLFFSMLQLIFRQARLLLPEPLAVNKGERIVGSLLFKVSYRNFTC